MTYSIEIRGLVQGVGFRPFISNLALSLGLNGNVSNNGYGVLILIECSTKELDEFVALIKDNKPQLSKIESMNINQIKALKFSDFKIKKSECSLKPSFEIPSDASMCKECQDELQDIKNRRYGYPFISCSSCGPRFSIIENMPYDRKNTSMKKFNMCEKCQDEYDNPQNRRYYAQTISCFECGPKLFLFNNDSNKLDFENIIDEVATLIGDGKIVAIKGIGGYHLVCDASNEKTVKLLRERKRRPSKPFAVMVKDIETSKKIAYIKKEEELLLHSSKSPIVLLPINKSGLICDLVAPNIKQIGVFLAYTPLHLMICERLNIPLIATSANISGEPLCKTHDEIMTLSTIWDYCLDNDRDIVNSCDDSVAFVENKKTFMLRIAKGYSPTYLKLPKAMDKKVLALGANQKSTVAICKDDKVVLSPYIGDLDSLASLEHFKFNIKRLEKIYDFEPEIVLCDKHPNYESTKFAFELKSKNDKIKLIQIQHHYAHVLAIMGVNKINTKVLGVSFDGTGYGDDGNLWGGEFLICGSDGYERVGHFKYFKLLGGDRAIKEPRRVSLSLLFELYGEDVLKLNNHTTASFTKSELNIFYKIWKDDLNSPLSSSCGRIFDAVASLLGLIQVCSYEGESGLLLESLYNENVFDSYDFNTNDVELDFSIVFKQIIEEKNTMLAVSKFFNTLVEIIYEMSKKYNLPLVLSGGVFQNRVLLRLIMKKIPDVVLPEDFISNDSSIAYGQIMALQWTFQ
jgi:hydrogenase maturation protein HypF